MAVGDWACRIGTLPFGTGTRYRLSAFDAVKPNIRTQDADMPAQDGIRMGEDFLSGTLVAVSLAVVTSTDPATAMELLADLRLAWNGDGVRETPGAVMQLRYQRPGAEERVVFGRPRRFSPATMSNVASGYVPVEADFQAADARFYSAVVHTLSISGNPISYSGTAGTTTPHVPPVTLAEATLPSDVATNAGTVPTWPVITFHGPRERPGLAWVGESRSVSLATVLADGQSVTIDTYPWNRTVLRGDGASLAGQLRGSRLSELMFSPGDTQLSFEGEDPTLTSRVDIEWRDAYGSL